MKPPALLALDTSTRYCSVALYCPDTPGPRAPDGMYQQHYDSGPQSSAHVLPAVAALLDQAGLELDDCTALAFGRGPGSFTGVRTAVGVAQGLAFGAALPVISVSSLLACAQALDTRRPLAAGEQVLVAVDARMDEVYWAVYARGAAPGEWQQTHAPEVGPPESVPRPVGAFHVAGNAPTLFGARLHAAQGAVSCDVEAMPHAAEVARLAWRAWQCGETLSADQAMPEYVRNKVAQTVAERAAARGTSAA